MLDLTWSGWDKITKLGASAKIPVVRADVTIRSFVKALIDFLSFRNGELRDFNLDSLLYFS